MKRRRKGDCFLPEVVKQRLEEQSRIQEDVNLKVDSLKNINISDLPSSLSEDDALTILTSKIPLSQVIFLKMAMDHVPKTLRSTKRGSSVCLRYTLISHLLARCEWASPENVRTYVQFLEKYCNQFCSTNHGQLFADYVWEANDKDNRFSKFVVPPVDSCVSCGKLLTMHNMPTKAVVYGISGPEPASKVTLECRHCHIHYGISNYLDQTGTGRHFYSAQLRNDLIEISNVTYMEKALYRWIPSLGNHCWASFSGFSESYNEVFLNEIERFQRSIKGDDFSVSPCEETVSMSEESSKQEQAACNSSGLADDTLPLQFDELSDDTSPNRGTLLGELSCKAVAQSYWTNELEEELKDLDIHDKWVFSSTPGHLQGNVTEAMEYIEKKRCETLYSHQCVEKCKEKGCGALYVADGNWKLKYAHCMWHVPIQVQGFNKPLNYPSICPLSPERGMAFCKEHCSIASESGLPTGLQDFLKCCSTKEKPEESPDNNIHENITRKLESVTANSVPSQINATTFQGTGKFIEENGQLLMEESSVSSTVECNKDTGGRKTLQSWSRGIFVIASGGGHIEYWQPLYTRSESPTQVFLVIVLWLYRKFQPLLEAGVQDEVLLQHMSKLVLAYDNMCHVDGMKVSKHELPFKYPLSQLWIKVIKVIDRLHLRNHKDKKCQTAYNPEGKIPKEYNTMAAEQTFVWASRLKRIVCAMPRTHQFLYLHRAIKRRNLYTQRCHSNNKMPLLPKQPKEWLQNN